MSRTMNSRRIWNSRWSLVVAAAGAVLTLSACSQDAANPGPTAAEGDDSFVVATSFYPSAYFVERLAGDFVKVELPLPADEDPAFWEPDADAMGVYQDADLVVLNGANFEHWAPTAPLPRSRIVTTAGAIDEGELIEVEGTNHSHGPAGEHSHTGTDGHTWTDPIYMKQQAGAIREALVERLPEHAAAIEANYDALAADFDLLDQRLRDISVQLGDRAVGMSHGSYRYPARRYGWTVIDLDLPPETDAGAIDPHTVEHLGELASPIILWEAEPNAGLKQRLTDEFGAVHVVYTPAESMGSVEENGAVDFLDAMNQNLDRLEAAVTGG